jgi:SAM-dependent methyltransferase
MARARLVSHRFAADLYRGTADDYERFRPPYPDELIAELLQTVHPSGRGLLVDLACGPGPLAFALADRYADVLAVDQETDMIRLVQTRSRARRLPVRAAVAAAEALDLAPGSVELVTIGTAFHRLDRDAVAQRVCDWLAPGGHLALCWAGVPMQDQDVPWQRAMAEVVGEWRDRLGVREHLPDGWDEDLRRRPDREVIAATGLEFVGRREVDRTQRWDAAELAGFCYSTSLLPRRVFGARTTEFEADLAERLRPFGDLVTHLSFAYELFRSPARD